MEELLWGLGVVVAGFVGALSQRLTKKKDAEKDCAIDKMKEIVDEAIRPLILEQLKYTITCPNVPLEERVKGGERYLDMGGNGEIKVMHHANEKKLEKKLALKESKEVHE